MTELSDVDATGQAQLVRDGKASPSELVDDAISRIEKFNPELNAVIHPLFDQARAAARGELPDGPFRGVPMVLKDLDGCIEGERYHCGNKLMKEIDFRATHTSYSHKKLQDAGFVFVGKTNCPEFGFTPTTEPKAYGATRNPWDPTRSTGGSSGGTAAAVASHMVAVGSAGDGGGSIRIPASECGLVGLKPSRGRVTLGPELGEAWHGLVVRGGLSRTVRDSAGVLDVMSGEVPGDPYTAPPFARPLTEEVGVDPGKLRIGFTTRPFADMAVTEDVCVQATRQAATLLESLGHHVEEDSPAALNDAEVISHGVTVIAAWARWELDHWGRVIGRTFGPDDVEEGTWQFCELAAPVTGTEYIKAVEALHSRTREAADWWSGGFDLLLTPTIPQAPPPLGSWEPTEENPMQGLTMSTQIVGFVAAFNFTGQPAISLPLYQSDDGLPIGVQLVAPYGREDLLVRIGSQLEAAAPWADRRPPLS
jgi:amidase